MILVQLIIKGVPKGTPFVLDVADNFAEHGMAIQCENVFDRSDQILCRQESVVRSRCFLSFKPISTLRVGEVYQDPCLDVGASRHVARAQFGDAAATRVP